jgi:hypothetical protein
MMTPLYKLALLVPTMAEFITHTQKKSGMKMLVHKEPCGTLMDGMI